jgi:hypothetical protein
MRTTQSQNYTMRVYVVSWLTSHQRLASGFGMGDCCLHQAECRQIGELSGLVRVLLPMARFHGQASHTILTKEYCIVL